MKMVTSWELPKVQARFESFDFGLFVSYSKSYIELIFIVVFWSSDILQFLGVVMVERIVNICVVGCASRVSSIFIQSAPKQPNLAAESRLALSLLPILDRPKN